MNNRSASHQDEQFADELQAEHDRYQKEVRAVLDLDAGLDDVFARAENAEYIEQLRHEVLDVEAGLAAALATAEDSGQGGEPDQKNRGGDDTTPPVSTLQVSAFDHKGDRTTTGSSVDVSQQPSEGFGTIFDRIAQLRGNITHKEMRTMYTKESLQEAVDQLDSLERGLLAHQLSQLQAHEELDEVKKMMVQKSWSSFRVKGTATGFVSVTAFIIGTSLQASKDYALDPYLLHFWAALMPLTTGAAALVIGVAAIISMGTRHFRKREACTVMVSRRVKRLHEDIDRLFDSSDEYSNARH